LDQLLRRFFQRGQRIDGLTALGDGQHSRLIVNDGIAVTVFRCNLNIDRNLCPLFNCILGDHACVIGSATCNYRDALNLLDFIIAHM